MAQTWRLEPSIGATLTATTNGGLSDDAAKRKDLILDLEPRVIVQGRGASFTLDGNIGGHGLRYINSTQPNRLLPTGLVSLNANLVERWLYFDAAIGAEQALSDPFLARFDRDSGLNKISTFQYRISPYLRHSFTPSLSLQVRSDNTWTKRRGEFTFTDPRRDSSAEKQSFLLEQKPLPFGFSAEVTHEKTKYSSGVETVLKIGAARLVGTYALDPTLVVGAVAGTEKSEFALSKTTDDIAGARFAWAPTERTELKASYEKRFFGQGGSVLLTHRSPFIGLSLGASRQPSALGTSFVVNSSGDLQTLLDAIFTTRYPNPADRAIIVKNVISGLGVPNALGTPIEVFSDYAQLRDSVEASIVFQGLRSTLTTRIYKVRARQLTLADAAFVPIVGIEADNIQTGGSVDLSRRLTPTLALGVSVGYAEIEGLGVSAGRSTSTKLASMGLTESLTPKTKVTVGVRYQASDLTDPLGNSSVDEVAGFVGIVHRF